MELESAPPPGAHFSTLDGAKGQVADFSTFGGPSAPGSTLADLTLVDVELRPLSKKAHWSKSVFANRTSFVGTGSPARSSTSPA